MNRILVFATVLAAGLATSTLIAQDAPAAAAPAAPAAQTPAPAAAAPAPPAVVPPQAIPAKIAIIGFEQAAGATNEGQKLVSDLRKKFESRENDIKNRATELDSLKKQLQALPATTADEDRAKRIKDIDLKDNQLQRDYKDLQDEEQSDFQDGFGKLMQKVGPVAVKYSEDNGFTIMLNVGSQQNQLPTVLWFQQSTDITQAVINAYNVSSGVAAQPPSAPPVHHTAPATHTAPAAPKPSTTQKPQ